MCYFTENHQILFHVTAYLAGQRTPKQVFANSGLTGRQQMSRAKGRIERWILTRLRGNFSEWDSNAYMTLDAFAMLALVDYAVSPRLRELATARPRFGYERLHILLTREGWRVGRNRVHRLYKLEGLQVRMRVRRRKCISLHRGPVPTATGGGQYWAMDFVHDQLANGRKFRVLTVIDKWHRQCVALHADFALTGQSVVDAMNEIALGRELPYAITVDHGTEFTSKTIDEWCYLHGVKLDFIRPREPAENGNVMCVISCIY